MARARHQYTSIALADHEIRTTIPLDELVTAILRLVDA
jgi:hypothetical protein